MSAESGNLVPGPDPESDHTSYFQVGTVDRAMAMLDMRSAVGFEAIVELEGHLDEESLSEAWTRLAALHPILACVRDDDAWRPGAAPPISSAEAAPGHDQPPVALRVTPIQGGARLTLLCNHVAFDGMASVILLRDLKDQYNAVLEGAEPTLVDWSPRTLEGLVEDSDWRSMAAAAMRGASAWWQMPVSTHVDPGQTTEHPATDHVVMEFGPVLQALASARHKNHWSTDAVLVGVLEKAWLSVFGTPTADSSWLVAQDLRPALGATRGIGNLSIPTGVSVPDPRSDLLATIDRVHAETGALGGDLRTAAAVITSGSTGPFLDRMLRKTEKLRCHRSMSNVGQLGDSLDNWGSSSASRIWFVGPFAHPPYTSFIAAGHDASTLVSVRTSPHWLTQEDAAALERAALELI